jgi:hypothetical protein
MIKIEDGVVNVSGRRIELIADFGCIMKSLMEAGVISYFDIMLLLKLQADFENEHADKDV